MGAPTPHTWTAGDDSTSANLQTITDTGLYNLGSTTSGGSRKPLATLRQTVAQSLANNTWVAIAFDAEGADYDNGHSTITNTSRYTSATAGYYLVSAQATFAGNATGTRLATLAVNAVVSGSTFTSGAVGGSEGGWGTVPNGGNLVLPLKTALVYLNAGDILELYALQASGGALNTAFANPSFGCSMDVLWVSN